MTDVPEIAASPAPARTTTAGGLIRQARQAQGVHIAVLAAAIKVTPRKLELLESDQSDQLLDATFTRALAQTVCRTLKIDAAPVLALLPPARGHRLEHVAEGLKTPFYDRPGRLVPNEWAKVATPTLWVAVLLVIAAVVVYGLPADWLQLPTQALTRTPEAEAQAPPDATPLATTESMAAPEPPAATSAEAGSTEAPAAAAPDAAEPVAGSTAPVGSVLQLRTSAPSWVEVTDARGQSLVARILQTGETVGIDAAPPLKLKIGNAVGTQVVFRGEPLDLAGFTRDNVARLELK